MLEIQLQGIEIQFPGMDAPLLQTGNRTIPTGSRILIQGPSGTGKTSLLHIMAGLMDPHRGRLTVDGTDLAELSEGGRCAWRRENVGLVFQRLNLLGHLTALENVLLGSPGGKIGCEKASEALKRLGVESLADQPAYHLSLGEQQRVAVARVITRRPRLILADEPTSSLDARNAERVIETLFGCVGPDGTLIVATHDDRIVSRFSVIWSLEEGEIR